jgi:hypothetical protein
MRMTVLDPLVSIKPSTEAARRGWAVAAAIIGRLQEADLVGIDLPAILRPVISALSELELAELDRQFYGPLTETETSLLGEWHAVRQVSSKLMERAVSCRSGPDFLTI